MHRRVDPSWHRHRHAEVDCQSSPGDRPLQQLLAVVEGLDPFGHHPTTANRGRSGYLVAAGDLGPNVDHHHAAPRHHYSGEGVGPPRPVDGHELEVDHGIAREGVEQRDRGPGVAGGVAPREVPPVGGGRGARGDIAAERAGQLMADHDFASHQLDHGGHRRGFDQVGEAHPLQPIGADHDLGLDRLGGARKRGEEDRAVGVGGIGDDDRVVKGTFGVAGPGGTEPGGAQRVG